MVHGEYGFRGKTLAPKKAWDGIQKQIGSAQGDSKEDWPRGAARRPQPWKATPPISVLLVRSGLSGLGISEGKRSVDRQAADLNWPRLDPQAAKLGQAWRISPQPNHIQTVKRSAAWDAGRASIREAGTQAPGENAERRRLIPAQWTTAHLRLAIQRCRFGNVSCKPSRVTSLLNPGHAP